MLTCRECKAAKEFSHFNPKNDPKTQQNLFCTKRQMVEPVWSHVRQGRSEFFKQLEAPDCFVSHGRVGK